MCSILPVPQTIYERAVLFDTGALEAIFDPRDQYHEDAVERLGLLKDSAYPFYVTLLTIAETHRRLLYKRHLGYPVALHFLHSVHDGSMNIVYPSDEDEVRAREYLIRYDDQAISYTDAISMAVVGRLGLGRVFSYDWHFTLIGVEMITYLIT